MLGVRSLRHQELRFAPSHLFLPLLELGEQGERLLRRLPVAGPLSVEPVALLAQALLPGGERRLPVHEHLRSSVPRPLERFLARRHRLRALLEPRPIASALGFRSLQLELPVRDRTLAAERRRVELADAVFACCEPRFRLLPARIERSALPLQLAFALADPGELLRDLRLGLGTLLVVRPKIVRTQVDVRRELSDTCLFRNELGALRDELEAVALDLVRLDSQDDLLLLELCACRLEAGRTLLELRFAYGQVALGCELSLVRLDLMLERLAQLLLAPDRRFELRLHRCELRRDGRCFDHELHHVAERLDRRRRELRLGDKRLFDDLLALELGAQPAAESGLGLVRHLRYLLMLSSAGPSSTTNSAGKMKIAVGKSILIGAFIAFSSAAACLRIRESAACTRRIRPSEIPSWSAWITERTNAATSGAGTRSAIFFNASCRDSPMRISPSVSANSSTSAPRMCSVSLVTAPSSPRPASTETASRSSASGSSERIRSRRPRMREVRMKSGRMKPNAPNAGTSNTPATGATATPARSATNRPPIARPPFNARN